MTKQVKIEDATPDQLKAFCEMVLGIADLADRPQRAKLLAKISDAGWTKDTIPVFDAPVAPAPTDGAGERQPVMAEYGPEGGPKKTGLCYRIVIATEDKPGGQDPVYVGVNGKGMYIPRGTAENVPVDYVANLENAVQDIHDPSENPLEATKPPRKVPSYPFTYV